MRTPDAAKLLQVWEQGAGRPPPVRALLLLRAAEPDADDDVLEHSTIGRRDHLLLELRDALFGPELHCVAECPHCGEALELDFPSDDIRVTHGDSSRRYHVTADGYEVQFRLPDSSDLIAVHAEAPTHPERRLLERCVLDARADAGDTDVAALPDSVVSAISREMSAADPQADVVLEVSCPACSFVSPAPFDIVSYLWTELDAWAHRMVREVHALAAACGWSETEILHMSAARRRAYLDVVRSESGRLS